MNLLFMIIIYLLIILFYLIRSIVKRKILFPGIKLIVLAVTFIMIGVFLDSKEFKTLDRAAEYYKNVFSIIPMETSAESMYPYDNDFELHVVKIDDQVLIDAPLINQMPELPRGCEVTSLAMLLNHAGVTVDKMTLAEQVKKNPAEYQVINGEIHYGHPNDGFVGDMYTYQNPGLGVYHKPIAELAEQYLPGSIVDLTGSDFQELKTHLNDGRPIWVIINTHYKELGPEYFETWHTPSGTIEITYKEHSVLITGYDENYVYFNDPLTNIKNRKAPIKDFEKSWVQMGRQAITYLK